LLAPRMTVLVTCVDKRGKPNIITLAWTMPTSFKPPLVAISVGHKRFSHQLIGETKEWVINVPPWKLLKKVELCGIRSGRVIDKFSLAGLTALPSERVRPPRIKECIAHLECRLQNEIRAGDHTIFVGEVVAASVDEDAFDFERNIMDLESFAPVLHLGESFYSTSKKVVSTR